MSALALRQFCGFTAEQASFAETTRRFAADVLAPGYKTREREGRVELRGEWWVTGLPAAGRGAEVTRFRISGRGEWLVGSVSLPNQGGDATMRELTIEDGQRCRVDAFQIVAGNRG